MATYPPLIMGVFRREADAEQALNALYQAGFTRNQIGFAFRERKAAPQNLLDDLVRLGVPQDRAGYYDNEFQSGQTIVSVQANGREQEAADILRRFGAYDYDSRDTAAPPAVDTTAPPDAYTATAQPEVYGRSQQADIGDERRSMPIREEVLDVEKQRVRQGEVRLHKEVVTEEQRLDVPVTHEEVYIQHRPVAERRVSDVPIGEDEVIRIPVTGEEVNVTKTPVVTGEVVVGKQAVEERRQITDTVRREEPRLETEGQPRVRTNDVVTNEDVENP